MADEPDLDTPAGRMDEQCRVRGALPGTEPVVALGGPGAGMDLISRSGDELEEEEGFVALVGTLGGAGLDLKVRLYMRPYS